MDKKKNFSTFSYKLVQISPIMILVNSGAFLSISSWFCELFYWLPPQNAKDYGYVQVANRDFHVDALVPLPRIFPGR